MRRAALTVLLAASLAPSLVSADSFTPVRLQITIASVARRAVKLPITIAISADTDALDSSAPLRMQVKLAPECGGTFAYTPGTVLLDQPLSPQPATGHAYTGTLSGAGRPSAFGRQTVCVYLDEQGDNREFATNQSIEVNVSRPCTIAATTYDTARQQLARARQRHRGVKAAAQLAAKRRRTARARCGPGVPL